MFHRYTKISVLLIFLCSGLALGQPILTFNSAFDFAMAVKKEQEGRLIECFGGAACCATAGGCCVTAMELSTIGIIPLLMSNAPDLITALPLEPLEAAGCLAGFCATNAGLVLGAYKLVTRSTDYNAAWRVVTYSCLTCLRENVLNDPNIAIRLNEAIRQAIIDAINKHAYMGFCVPHNPQRMVY